MRQFNPSALALSAAALLAGAAGAQVTQPIITPDGLVFPDDNMIPRSLTENERIWLERHPLASQQTRAVTAPPMGPIHCMAEYEPADGICLSYTSFTNIVAQMARWITTDGNAIAYVGVTPALQASATSNISGMGADMSKVQFNNIARDTVWIRDYGPRYCYEGDCRVITDHQYNRPRPNDDAFPISFASLKGHQLYSIGTGSYQLIHGGGNYHLDALGRSYCTKLITNENPTLTQTQVHDIWQSYQNVDTWFFDPFPTSVDATQHLDMWMQVLADNKVVVSDWPLNSGSTQDVICDNAAVFMANRGYTVFRVPAFSVGGVHYTFTNVVICNNLLLLPTYTNTTVVNNNGNNLALSAWQSALPAASIRQINCDAMVASAGVMHCIAMHVPKHKGAPGPNGGLAPTAYLQTLRGGEVLPPGSSQSIKWISDDDALVSAVDIHYSTDGGATYPNVIALNQPRLGSFSWTVPSFCSTRARIRVTARDALGNTGSDASTSNLTFNAPLPGDLTGDHIVNSADLVALLGNFGQPVPPNTGGDFDGNGTVNSADLVYLLGVFGTDC